MRACVRACVSSGNGLTHVLKGDVYVSVCACFFSITGTVHLDFRNIKKYIYNLLKEARRGKFMAVLRNILLVGI